MKEVDDRACEEAKVQVCYLIEKHWTRIIQARNAAAVAASEQGKETFRYAVALKFTQEPKGNECDVSAAIAYNVAHKDETVPKTVDSHPQLPLGDQKK